MTWDEFLFINVKLPYKNNAATKIQSFTDKSIPAGDFQNPAWLYKLFASKQMARTMFVWTYEYNLHSYIWIVLCEGLQSCQCLR